MKRKYKNVISILFLIFGTGLFLNSCHYQEIGDASYPDQKIYFPASKNGIYTINTITKTDASQFTTGFEGKYKLDLVNKKIIIPLGVYRSGIDDRGTFDVNIINNTDTVSKLITKGTLIGDLLPTNQYSIPSKVVMKDGSEVAPFEVAINTDYFKNYPNSKFAIGISIQSDSRATSKLNTVIVLLETKMFFPVPNFTFKLDAKDPLLAVFTNTSSYAIKYEWDFGDGSPKETTISPQHLFSQGKIFNVTLTAYGILGDEQLGRITIPVKAGL